jgi:hypothetical protein
MIRHFCVDVFAAPARDLAQSRNGAIRVFLKRILPAPLLFASLRNGFEARPRRHLIAPKM